MRIASFLFCQQGQSQVGTIQSNIEHLNGKLAEAQEAKQDLLAIKHKLEQVILSVDILQEAGLLILETCLLTQRKVS